MDELEDTLRVQAALTLKGILDNALAMFDHLTTEQKDTFIKKYEGRDGRTEDFQDA